MSYFVKETEPVWETIEEVILPQMPSFTQNELEMGVGNCSLASMVRLLGYFRNAEGAPFPDDTALYQAVKRAAAKRGYQAAGRGTPFYNIAGILSAVLSEYGYPGTGKSRYVWSFSGVKKTIDAGLPVIFNIAFGHYKNHTVTVVGYKIVTDGIEKKKLLAVYDGWTKNIRYIDVKHLHIGSITFVKRQKRKKGDIT